MNLADKYCPLIFPDKCLGESCASYYDKTETASDGTTTIYGGCYYLGIKAKK